MYTARAWQLPSIKMDGCGRGHKNPTNHTITCYACSMGRSDVPDMYVQAQGSTVPKGK